MYDEKEMEAYRGMLMKMLHGKETQDQIDQMLQSGDPQKVVPETAKMVASQANQAMKQGGVTPSLETQIGGSMVLGTELVEIGNAGGYFQVGKEDAMPIVELTSKAIIKEGIANGTIDPVELQEMTNEAMPEEGTKMGLAASEKIPNEADEGVAMEQYARGREKQALSRQGALTGGQR